MTKHIIDRPRTRGDNDRLEHYTKIDRQTAGKRTPQSETLDREARTRNPGEKLRRYAKFDRRD